MKTGLILEGGGMRGVYTGGVLEKFLEEEIFTDYIIGVSAGACNASSFISRQNGRNHAVTIGYVHHPDYISMKNWFKKRELFGMDLIFDEIPNKLVPFNYDDFNEATEEFVVGTTDCLTGEAVYFEKRNEPKEVLAIVRASSSLPFMSHPVEFEGSKLMDGGIADPIPIRKAMADGVTHPIVVLTKEKGYRKKKSSFSGVLSALYRQFPGIVKSMEKRYLLYNETMEFIEELEAAGEVLVIRPSKTYKIGRIERNPEKLTELYNQGYEDAEEALEKVKKFIDK